jgi:hypothetical protein
VKGERIKVKGRDWRSVFGIRRTAGTEIEKLRRWKKAEKGGDKPRHYVRISVQKVAAGFIPAHKRLGSIGNVGFLRRTNLLS